MDEKEIRELIDWKKSVGTSYHDLMEDFINPLMEAFGDDVNEILSYLNEMEIEDLSIISGCFEEIYGKFMTDEVYAALGELEQKIENRN